MFPCPNVIWPRHIASRKIKEDIKKICNCQVALSAFKLSYTLMTDRIKSSCLWLEHVLSCMRSLLTPYSYWIRTMYILGHVHGAQSYSCDIYGIRIEILSVSPKICKTRFTENTVKCLHWLEIQYLYLLLWLHSLKTNVEHKSITSTADILMFNNDIYITNVDSLKRKYRYFDKTVVTGCIGRCHFDTAVLH